MTVVRDKKLEMSHFLAPVTISGLDDDCSRSKAWNEPQRQKTYLRIREPSKDSGQTSVIWIFAGRIFDSEGFKVSSCGQRRLWSDCADVQADWSLHWAYMSESTFSQVAARSISELEMALIDLYSNAVIVDSSIQKAYTTRAILQNNSSSRRLLLSQGTAFLLDCVYAQRRLRSACASARSDQSSLSVWRHFGFLASRSPTNTLINANAQADQSFRLDHRQSCRIWCAQTQLSEIKWMHSGRTVRVFHFHATDSSCLDWPTDYFIFFQPWTDTPCDRSS